MTHDLKISFIGGGNMATAMLSGLQNNGFTMQNICVVELNVEKGAQLSAQFNVQVTDRLSLVEQSNLIILATKPQQLKEICFNLNKHLASQLVISIAAGIRTKDISRWLNGYQSIIRVMPNTPAQIQAGVSALYARDEVTQTQRNAAIQIMNAIGKTLWLENENEMDAVTAISGSGPAYVFYFIEALTEAALKLGLSTENARLLALETFAGASLLAAQSPLNVESLRTQVTSKGGTTEQSLLVLESANIKEIIYQSAKAAAEKSVILGDALGN